MARLTPLEAIAKLYPELSDLFTSRISVSPPDFLTSWKLYTKSISMNVFYLYSARTRGQTSENYAYTLIDVFIAKTKIKGLV